MFGSVARGEERPDSDVDVLVNLPVDMGLLALGRACEELEKILKGQSRSCPAAGLKRDVANRIVNDLVPL